jgi:hypothetical protein
MERTSSYSFTTESVNDPRIDNLRMLAKVYNATAKLNEIRAVMAGEKLRYVTRHQVIVRPRLGKDNPNAPLYRRGGSLHRSSSQTIRPEHGTRFDVYLHPRRVWK